MKELTTLIARFAPKWEVETNEVITRPVKLIVRAWSKSSAIEKAQRGEVEEAFPMHHLTVTKEKEILSARRAK